MNQSNTLAIVNCDFPNWSILLIYYLQEQSEVDLINARTHVDAVWVILHDAAERFSMTFERDHESRTVRFRRKSN